jgi:hypothetical protein
MARAILKAADSRGFARQQDGVEAGFAGSIPVAFSVPFEDLPQPSFHQLLS